LLLHVTTAGTGTDAVATVELQQCFYFS